MEANPFRLGLVVGLVMGVFHACWAALVAGGFAQPLMDFIFWVHFLNSPFVVQTFELPRALILVGLTFSIGLAMGTAAALLWSMCARRSATD